MKTVLEGSTAIVVGAATGLGRQIALVFAEQGAGLVLVDYDESGLKSVAGEVTALGGRAVLVPGDAADPSTSEAAVSRASSEFGGLDILVYNAAISPMTAKAVLATSVEDWKRVYDVNVTGAFMFAKAALPLMVRERSGSVVFTSSTGAVHAPPGLAAYNSSKAAMIALSSSIASDYGEHNVRSNCILPGFMEGTLKDRGAHLTEDDMRRREQLGIASTPLGRLGSYREVANVVLFLASSQASFVSGVALPVDGAAGGRVSSVEKNRFSPAPTNESMSASE